MSEKATYKWSWSIIPGWCSTLPCQFSSFTSLLQSAIQSFIILNYVNCKMQNLCSFEICFNYVLCTFMDISQYSQNDHHPSPSTELWTPPPNIAQGQCGHSSKLGLGDGLKIITHDRFFSHIENEKTFENWSIFTGKTWKKPKLT